MRAEKAPRATLPALAHTSRRNGVRLFVVAHVTNDIITRRALFQFTPVLRRATADEVLWVAEHLLTCPPPSTIDSANKGIDGIWEGRALSRPFYMAATERGPPNISTPFVAETITSGIRAA